MIRELPYTFLVLFRAFAGSATALLLGTRMIAAALVMLAPTILLGAIFPLVVRAAIGRVDAVGRVVGRLYSVNTLGAIVGAFATGFALIPLLGVEGTLVAAVGFNLVAAALVVLASESASRWLRIGVALFLVVLTAFLAPLRPEWDPAVMASGVYRYAPSIKATTRSEFYQYYANKGDGETVYYRDGVSATVAVQKQLGYTILKVNGKPDASTAGDLPTQALVAHLPLLAHPDPKSALVIGWGSGVTVGAALTHPLDTVTAVELEPAVVEASHFFDDANGRPLKDPRLELLLNDGRNFLVGTDRRFDVIISEPSNPWLSGVANLFTREYFDAGAARLNEGGIFCQWLQIYEMRPADVETLLATFAHSFQTVYVFRGASGDLMLLGARTPFSLDFQRIDGRILAAGPVATGLARIGVRSAAALLSRLYLTPPAVAEFTRGAPLNTDDNARIEFQAPLHVGVAGEETESSNVSALEGAAKPVLPFIAGAPDSLLEDMAISAIARSEPRRAEKFVDEALSRGESARAHSILGELRAAAGRDEEALAEWQRAIAIAPDDLATNLDLGKYYLGKGNFDFALAHLDRAVAAAPDNPRAHHLRGIALQARGGAAEAALEEIEKARSDGRYLENNPALGLAYGRALRDVGRYDEARAPLEAYTAKVTDDPIGFFELGQLDLIEADRALDAAKYAKAEQAFVRALTIDPTFADAHRSLSLTYRKQGRLDEAQSEFTLFERYRDAGH